MKTPPFVSASSARPIGDAPIGADTGTSTPSRSRSALGWLVGVLPARLRPSRGEMLRPHRRGLTPLALNRLPDAYAIEAAGNANAGATWTYDGLLAHDLLNLAAAGMAVASSSALRARYRARLRDMLAHDVAAVERACARNAKLPRLGMRSARPVTDDERARYPALDAHYREADARLQADAAFVGNLIVTRDKRGQWKYDKNKLLRIAKDNEHPQRHHARDVLTLSYIEGWQGSQARKDALYQTFMSGLGATASALMIAGTHGAALPVVAAGYAVAASREAFALRKPFAEARQLLRDAKAAQIMRVANYELRRLLENRSISHADASDAGERVSLQMPPSDVPLEARAAVVAAVFAKAERQVSNQRFGPGIPGRQIDHRRSTAAMEDERSIVVDHALGLIRDLFAQTSCVSTTALTELQAIAHAPDRSVRRRVRALSAHVRATPALAAAHTLLVDMGLRKTEALDVVTQLVDGHLAATSGIDISRPLGNDTARIADLVNQPQLKRDPLQAASASLQEALGRRWLQV